MTVKKSTRPRKANQKPPKGHVDRDIVDILIEDSLSLKNDPDWKKRYQEHPILATLEMILWKENFLTMELSDRQLELKVIGEKDEALEEKLQKLRVVASELSAYCWGPHSSPTEAEIEEWVAGHGYDLQEFADRNGVALSPFKARDMLNDYEKQLRKRRRGRPADRQRIAVTALEMKLEPSKPSWTKVTERLCPCGQPKHSHSCMQALRQSVMALQRVLREYKILSPPL